MKLIAENRIEITRQLFNEGMRTIENKKYKKLTWKIALIILAICAAGAMFLLHTGSSLVYLAGEGIFFAAMLAWVAYMLPRNKRKSSYQAMCRKSGGVPARTVRFYQEHMTILSETGNETTILYKDVLECHETKHLWVLISREKIGVLLKKDGFTTGNAEIIKTVIQ